MRHLVIVRNACFSTRGDGANQPVVKYCDVIASADQWISSSLVWTEAALAHPRLSCVDKQGNQYALQHKEAAYTDADTDADADADMQILVSI